MNNLPRPAVLIFDCVDRLGRTVQASVTVGAEADSGPFIWHAIFPGTGSPPAEILGSSTSIRNVRVDVSARVARLDSNLWISDPSAVPARPL